MVWEVKTSRWRVSRAGIERGRDSRARCSRGRGGEAHYNEDDRGATRDVRAGDQMVDHELHMCSRGLMLILATSSQPVALLKLPAGSSKNQEVPPSNTSSSSLCPSSRARRSWTPRHTRSSKRKIKSGTTSKAVNREGKTVRRSPTSPRYIEDRDAYSPRRKMHNIAAFRTHLHMNISIFHVSQSYIHLLLERDTEYISPFGILCHVGLVSWMI